MEWKDLQPDIYKAAILGVLALCWKFTRSKFKKGYSFIKRALVNIENIEELILNLHIETQHRKAFLHIAKSPVYILDCESGDLVWANIAWLELLGFRNFEDAEFMGWMQAIPEEDVDDMFKENERFRKNPSNFNGIVRFRNIETSKIITCKCRNQLIYDINDNPTKAMGILEVIS